LPAAEGDAPTFYQMFSMPFDSPEQLEEVMSSPGMYWRTCQNNQPVLSFGFFPDPLPEYRKDILIYFFHMVPTIILLL
jgi:hypothetical protein